MATEDSKQVSESSAGVTVEQVIYASETLVEDRPDGPVHCRIITENVDRTNDLVVVRGGRYGNYRENPLVLYEHIGGRDQVDGVVSYPIGRCTRLWIEQGPDGDELHGLDQLDDDESNPVGQLASRMVRKRMINGVSVALLPVAAPDEIAVTPEMVRDGKAYPFVRRNEDRPTVRIYRDWEKLEHSLVIIPTNGRSVVMKSYAQRAALDYLMAELMQVIAPHVSNAVQQEVKRLHISALRGDFDQCRFVEVSANEMIDAAVRRRVNGIGQDGTL